MDLIEICKMGYVLWLQKLLFFFFRNSWNFLQNRSHIKKKPEKYNKIEIISCILSDLNGMKIETRSKKNHRNYTNKTKIEQHTFERTVNH
jgi:hypothetical protein